MNINTLKKLAEWGFNVPKFVFSPGKHFKRDAIHTLRELFLRSESVCLLAVREDGVKSKTYDELHIPDAYMRSQALEDSFYTTVIVENVPFDMKGIVVFERTSGGTIKWTVDNKKYASFCFGYPEAVPDLKLRHVVRECQHVRDRVWKESPEHFVKVEWRWAVDFMGVNGARLVIYTYEIA